MKIAITHPFAWPEVRRGAERMIVETGRALAARGHRVTVFTSGTPDIPGVRVVSLTRRHEDPFEHERHFARQVFPRLLIGRFDVVHSLMPYDAAAAVLSGRLVKHRVVYEELGVPNPDWWARRLDGWLRAWLVRTVDVYGCMSEYARSELETRFGRVGDVIPGGVRLDQFTPGRREPEPTILYSGTLDEPYKGVPRLVDSMELLVEKRPSVRLWLSGQGDSDGLLERASDSVRDRVVRVPLGDPMDQGARYSRAWVTVLPSTGDSFGLVLIESLAAGTPIVVGNSGNPPSLVTPQTGVVAEALDAESLSAALDRGLELATRAETADACRASVARYDWDAAIAPLLEDLYRPDRKVR
jgi:phosphatidyl-myo-inositol alpha-mannosyltransferase